MKILLTNGTSLTSRQLSTILSNKGHEVHTLSTPGINLCKLTHHVTKSHLVPKLEDGWGRWLNTTISTVENEVRETGGKFGVVVCCGEEAVVLEGGMGRVRATGTRCVVWDGVGGGWDRVGAWETLRGVGLKTPESRVVSSLDEASLSDADLQNLVPGYVRVIDGEGREYGDVKRIENIQQLREIVEGIPITTSSKGKGKERQIFDSTSSSRSSATSQSQIQTRSKTSSKVLDKIKATKDTDLRYFIQTHIPGSKISISAILSHGLLISWHSTLRLHSGPRGTHSSAKKVSLPLPTIETSLVKLGEVLGYHGPLTLSALLTPEGEVFYTNMLPWLSEPTNALLSGVDLVQDLLDLSLGILPSPGNRNTEEGEWNPKKGIEGVETHSLLLDLLRSGERGRLWIVLEWLKALMGFERFAGSREELWPVESWRDLGAWWVMGWVVWWCFLMGPLGVGVVVGLLGLDGRGNKVSEGGEREEWKKGGGLLGGGRGRK